MSGTRRRHGTAEDGFSLVELMVIVLIIGVLAGIAITTFLNQTQKAERAAAVSTLSNMRLAAESIRADGDTEVFSGAPADYEAEQSSYAYTTGASEGTGQVSLVAGPAGDWVAFAVRGKGQCFYLRIEAAAERLFQHRSDLSESGTCVATDFAAVDGIGWT